MAAEWMTKPVKETVGKRRCLMSGPSGGTVREFSIRCVCHRAGARLRTGFVIHGASHPPSLSTHKQIATLHHICATWGNWLFGDCVINWGYL